MIDLAQRGWWEYADLQLALAAFAIQNSLRRLTQLHNDTRKIEKVAHAEERKVPNR